MVAGDQLRLGLGHVERQPVGLGEARDEKDEEGQEEGQYVPEPELLVPHDGRQAHAAGQEQNRDQAQPHGHLVGDHLGAGSEAAEQGVLAVR